jgi:hypothetical protein
MTSKLTFLFAAAVFLAFAGLRPADVSSPEASSEAPAENAAAVDVPGAGDDSVRDSVEARQGLVTARELAIESALGRLSGAVVRQSHPDALRHAFQAYFSYRAEHPGKVRKPYFYFVDFGLDSRTPRGYVFDMETLAVVEGPFRVSHGRGSVTGDPILPTRFLNTRGSNATSLGLYLAQETYNFRGRSGGGAYRSIGLRLKGESGRFNSAARERGIVVHGAPYVTGQNAGRSEGCPAMEMRLAHKLIPMLANGGLVFHFSPRDSRWMSEDPWANRVDVRLTAAD